MLFLCFLQSQAEIVQYLLLTYSVVRYSFIIVVNRPNYTPKTYQTLYVNRGYNKHKFIREYLIVKTPNKILKINVHFTASFSMNYLLSARPINNEHG